MTKFGKLLTMLVACDIVTLTRLHEPKCFIYRNSIISTFLNQKRKFGPRPDIPGFRCEQVQSWKLKGDITAVKEEKLKQMSTFPTLLLPA